MPQFDVARASLYRGIINLWVEDDLTREYLAALWNDPDILFLVAGGNDGVKAVVTDAEHAGYYNVFGLIDRDFRPSNRGDWRNRAKNFRTFVLPVHEIENYLLNPPALAASRLNTLGQTEAQIQAHFTSAAKRLRCWAACRSVVAELKRRFRDEFIPDPPRNLADEATAVHHIVSSDWFLKLDSVCGQTDEADVRQLLTSGIANADGQIGDGRWREEFSGKEVFRDAGSRICDRTRISSYQPKPAEFDIDLAKDVAAWQVENQRVPADLVELRLALRDRIARNLAP